MDYYERKSCVFNEITCIAELVSTIALFHNLILNYKKYIYICK